MEGFAYQDTDLKLLSVFSVHLSVLLEVRIKLPITVVYKNKEAPILNFARLR